MRFLRRFFLWFGIATLALIALFLLNVGVHRLLGPNAAQREALAALETARNAPREGTNAFPLLWLMRHDVADADIERIAADDVREAEARVADGRSLADLVPADRPLLAVPGGTVFCEERVSGCLARVRAHLDVVRAQVEQHPRWIERMRMFEGKDHYRIELPVKIETPLPNPGPAQRLRLGALALDWVEGRHEAALAGVCDNIGAWRRLRQGADSLVFSMMAVASMHGGIDLFADMLAELPADADVAPACAAAFAPIEADDVSMCAAFAAELVFVKEAVQQMSAPPGTGSIERFFTSLGHSSRQPVAWMAERHARHCGAAAADHSLHDRRIPSMETSIPRLACASALVDCSLATVANPAYADYHARLLDNAARLRLGATLLWLRETRDDPRPLAERFAVRPDRLRSGTRETGIGADGRSLWVTNLDTRRFGERTTLALTPAAEPAQ